MSQQKYKVKDRRQYVNSKRQLNISGLQERFNTHKNLRHDEIDVLFADYKPPEGITEIQYRYLEVGIRWQGIFDIKTSDFDPKQTYIICYDMIIRDILTGKTQQTEPLT